MSELSRRQFLHDSLLAAAAATVATAAPTLLAAEVESASSSANEKLGACVIGANGRGNDHLAEWTSGKLNTEVVVICDADRDIGEKRCAEVAKKQSRKPAYVQDLREALANKSVDFVSIATPNHWHALAAIWAMQAGKDVYVEKPVCHNISEGRRIVEAARKYNKICQTGTQSRSTGGTRQTIDYIHSGKLGEVTLAQGLCYKPRGSIGAKGDYQPPSSVDYSLWCGPARLDPLTRPRLHYDWHWVWSTGNGDLGNQGIHQMDIARWGLGVDTLPTGVITYGGRFGYEDAGETPNTEVTVLDYGPKTLIFEVRGLKTPPQKDVNMGVIFQGTEGYAIITENYNLGTIFDNDMKVVKKFDAGGNHFANFIQAVRSRKKEDLNADILEGFLSSSLCHLGNISYRLGEPLSMPAVLERLQGVKMVAKAQGTLDRTVEHLTENNVKLDDKTRFQCGEYLKFNPAAESFVGNSKADALLSRDYRAPFVVPAAGQV